MSFQSTSKVLNALKAKLEGLVFPDDAPVMAGLAVFESVRVYDVPRLEQALKDLLEYKNRICLIVPRPEKFRGSTKGGNITVSKHQDFLLILTDKDYSTGKPALFGSDTQPGVLSMCEVVVEELIAETLGLPDILLVPEDGESIRVSANEKNLSSGREGYRLFLSTPMGSIDRSIGRGRSLKR